MSKSTLPAVGYVTVAAVDAILAGRPEGRARQLRYLTKPALMPLLARATSRSAQGTTRTLTAAQALSWGGDVALLGRGDRAFQAGLGSFLGAHLAYVTGFALRGDRVTAPPSAGVKAAGVVLLTTGPLMTWAAGRTDRELVAPVAVYSTALAAMFAAASRLDPALSPRARRTVQAGAALFLVSDTLLALQKFVLGRPVPALETAVMATYTAGQGLIAAGSTHL
jgi:uncharacterized membrane protein YhhN